MYLKLKLSSLKVKLDANMLKKSKYNSFSFFFVQSHENNFPGTKIKSSELRESNYQAVANSSLDHCVFTSRGVTSTFDS